MFFASLIAALPGFLLKFVGGNVLQTVLSSFEKQAASGNELERIKAGTIRDRLSNETVRRGQAIVARVERQKRVVELQLKELENPWTAWPKNMLAYAVSLYWVARFVVKTFGLDDFGVSVSPLNIEETTVSAMVLGYWFLDEQLKKRRRGE